MQIKTNLQDLRLKIGKYFLDKKPHFPQVVGSDNCQKILFLRQDGKIGDYIVSSFAFRELKKHNPQIEIHIVCTSNNAYLFRKNNYIDHLHIVKKRSIIDLIKCGLKLRKITFDMVIQPTILLRNRELFFLRLLNAKNYIGYQKNHYQLFNYNIEDPMLHFSDVYLKALYLCGLNEVNTQYDIPFEHTIEQDVQNFLAHNHIEQNFIAVNFYGNGNNRSFNQKNIQQFLSYFAQYKNKQFVLLTTPNEYAELYPLVKYYDNIFLNSAATTIFHSIALIRRAKLVITPDTAIVHIASGLNKKLIAFYSTNKQNFANWQPNNRNTTYILRYQSNVNEIQPQQILSEWL